MAFIGSNDNRCRRPLAAAIAFEESITDSSLSEFRVRTGEPRLRRAERSSFSHFSVFLVRFFPQIRPWRCPVKNHENSISFRALAAPTPWSMMKIESRYQHPEIFDALKELYWRYQQGVGRAMESRQPGEHVFPCLNSRRRISIRSSHEVVCEGVGG